MPAKSSAYVNSSKPDRKVNGYLFPFSVLLSTLNQNLSTFRPMSLEKITQVVGRGVFVPGNDIDTDRIIPARYLKCITFDDLAEGLFIDVRKNADGTDKPHPLNEPRFKGANILLSGANFGCGSSPEHAPPAVHKHAFRAHITNTYSP